jgi:hypothetical protein
VQKGGISWKMTKINSISTVVAKLPPNAIILCWHLGGIKWKFKHRLFSWWRKGGNW